MRLNSILVVVVATFVVSCDPATAAERSEHTQLSTLTSVNAAPMKNARFLRSARTEEEENEEERKIPSYLTHPLLAPEKQVVAAAKAAEKATKLTKYDDEILTNLMKIDGGMSRFMRWQKKEFTLAIAKKILTESKVRPNGPEWQTYYQYLAAILRQNHKVN
ncbi:Avr1b-1 avirulence-like protein [Phytophthora sojae]|uniref:RxLR effector protein n=2 Tax=Phytophthora sojae TaxID=67593 RepID=G4ZLV6_PHYSP|nr:Avr1b-1 avirulence-like protein [Phytophthora sojae]AEK80666.1 Avh102 [Phytophthora sojae]AEK80668.1 Avh102 [Phytophthora sojae]EGZ15291.1 Avr1b-1 avirulence-like protein [Phytophthora sojae]|eukprot:XP_009529040.1 Avr1b-1 avirulence-like protein [Phytophthora sojae]